MAAKGKEIGPNERTETTEKSEKTIGQYRPQELNRMPEKHAYREVSEHQKEAARFKEKTENRRTLGMPKVEGFDKSGGASSDQDIEKFLGETFPEKHVNNINMESVRYKDRHGTDKSSIENSLAREVGGIIHNEYLDKKDTSAWEQLSGGREAAASEFAENYRDYIKNSEALAQASPERYNFMKERVFGGREYRVQETGSPGARKPELNTEQELCAKHDVEKNILENEVMENFPVAKDKQIDNSKGLHFLDEKELAQELKNRFPEDRVEEGTAISGFEDSRDNQAFVIDNPDSYETGVHEKLHQKSKSELPTCLDEGITQYFTREKIGGLGELKSVDNHGREIPKSVSAYGKDVEIVQKLDAVVGRKPLYGAYFNGDTQRLQLSVDNALGEGAYEKITTAMKEKNYKKAVDIIKQ